MTMIDGENQGERRIMPLGIGTERSLQDKEMIALSSVSRQMATFQTDMGQIASPLFWNLVASMFELFKAEQQHRAEIKAIRDEIVTATNDAKEAHKILDGLIAELAPVKLTPAQATELAEHLAASARSCETVLNRCRESIRKTEGIRSLQQVNSTLKAFDHQLVTLYDALIELLEDLSLIPELSRRLEHGGTAKGRPWREVWASLK